MTEREFLQQLYLLRCDMADHVRRPSLWALQLGDLLDRRLATIVTEGTKFQEGDMHEALRSRLLMAAKSIHIATDKAVADDVSQLLVEAEKALAEIDKPIIPVGMNPPVIPVRMDDPGPFDELENKLDEQQAQREAAGRGAHSTGD